MQVRKRAQKSAKLEKCILVPVPAGRHFSIFFRSEILDPLPGTVASGAKKRQIHGYRSFLPPLHGLFRERGGIGTGIRFSFPCKRAQKRALMNGRKRAQKTLPRKNCKQPGLKQPGLRTPKTLKNFSYHSRSRCSPSPSNAA